MISSLCFLFFCFLKCVPTQANNAYVRDQWYHSIIWKVLVNFPLIGFLRATLMNFLFYISYRKIYFAIIKSRGGQPDRKCYLKKSK